MKILFGSMPSFKLKMYLFISKCFLVSSKIWFTLRPGIYGTWVMIMSLSFSTLIIISNWNLYLFLFYYYIVYKFRYNLQPRWRVTLCFHVHQPVNLALGAPTDGCLLPVQSTRFSIELAYLVINLWSLFKLSFTMNQFCLFGWLLVGHDFKFADQCGIIISQR